MIKHAPIYRAAIRCLLAVLVILILLSSNTSFLYADEAAPQSDIQSALTQVQDSFADLDEYQFTAQIEQTLIPRATAANIGRSEERIDSQLNGIITPEKNTLDLRFEGNNMPNLLLEQVDGQTFLVQDGERTQIEDPLAASAPGGSFAGYLHAATNLIERSDPNFPNYTIYQFELDGQAFADHLIEQVQATLPTNEHYRVYSSAHAASMMSGTGELWLDNEGILRRQIMDIAIPEVNDQYDLQSNIVVDYRYDNEASAIYGLPEVVTPTISETTTSADILPTAQEFTPALFYYLAVIALGFGILYIMLRHPRKLRVALPIILALLMVGSPLLQPAAQAAANDPSSLPSLSDILGGSQEIRICLS